MIQSRRLLAAAALACLVLAGCEKKAAEGNKAAGEVLEGTITDAMIATDEVRSEPPLAPHAAKAAGAKGGQAGRRTCEPQPAPPGESAAGLPQREGEAPVFSFCGSTPARIAPAHQ